MRKIAMILVAGALFASCSQSTSLYTAQTAEVIDHGIHQLPMTAELDIKDTKVKGVAFGKISTPIDQLKDNAIANALKTVNADVLVEPIFEIVRTSSRIDVIVTGYPGTYKNFRLMTEDDKKKLRVHDASPDGQVKSSAMVPGTNNADNKDLTKKAATPAKSGASVGGILVGTLLIAGLIGALAYVGAEA